MQKICLIIFFSIFCASCADLYINDIDVDYSATATFPGQPEVPAIPGVDIPTLSLEDIGFNEFTQFDINASQTFQERVGSVSKVTFINLQTFELATNDPNLSLNFLDQIKVFISMEGDSEVLLAYKDFIPQNVNRVYLDVERELDLTTYIKSENITIRTEISGVLPEQDTDLSANLIFLVDTSHTFLTQ